MPKYRKKRFNYPPYAAAYPVVQMGMPMPMYPFGAPPIPPVAGPIPGFPLPFVKPESADPRAAPNSAPPTHSEAAVDAREHETAGRGTPGRETAERACLPFFDDEIKETLRREPTDILIVDFDRTLLATPLVNRDLFDRSSRHLLEFKLGPGNGWWQCRPVLEAAIAQGRWNTDLVEVAKEAAARDNIVLVVTTARKAADIEVIEDALAGVGITRVDHFACSTPSLDEDEDHSDSALGGWAKKAMLELLLESYTFLERVFVFDNNKSDRHKYSRAVSQFVRDGWLNAEAFHLLDFPLQAPIHPGSLVSQRELVERVLEHANAPVSTSVVVLEWLHKLTLESQREIAAAVTDRLGDKVDRVLCEDINISKGSLPPDLRGLAQRGAQWKWHVTGYKVESRLLWLQLQAVSGAGQHTAAPVSFKAARLVREFNEDEAATELGSFAQAPDIDTFVYERRELRIQRENRT